MLLCSFKISEPEEQVLKKKRKRENDHIQKSEGNKESKWLYP